jgi:hypothetical protein
VKEICNITKAADWRHVPGQENPADLPPRGCTVRKLIQAQWWEGPSWLRLAEEAWPSAEPPANEEEDSSERKKEVVMSLICEVQREAWCLTYFSRYTIVLRMVSWMLRFANNARRRHLSCTFGELLVDEIVAVEKIFVRMVQKEVFSWNEIPGLKSMQVFEDKEGTL